MRRLLNTFDRLNIPILEFHSREKVINIYICMYTIFKDRKT